MASTLTLDHALEHEQTRPTSLRIERTDISFGNTRPDLVEIRVRVTNAGDSYSRPTLAALSAAPLGAFLSWRPLAIVQVPGIAPGESYVVRAEARRPRLQPLGTPDRVPPHGLLTAMGEDDGEPVASHVSARMGEALRALFGGRRGLAAARHSGATVRGELPPDPLELLSRPGAHWAGNLNVFIGGQAVERHMAQALRVYPGRPILAIFFVGSERDSYSFQLKGEAAEWETLLIDATRGHSLVVDVASTPAVPLSQWVEVNGRSMMILALCPPKDCRRGTVEVHVQQRSTGDTAIVEFSLDPHAAGPGCYVV